MKIASQSPTTLNGTSPWTRLFRRSILLMVSVSKTTEPYSITSFSSFETHNILTPINELLQPDPVEIVTPVVKADSTWRTTTDQFWSIIRKHFDFAVIPLEACTSMSRQCKADLISINCVVLPKQLFSGSVIPLDALHLHEMTESRISASVISLVQYLLLAQYKHMVRYGVLGMRLDTLIMLPETILSTTCVLTSIASGIFSPLARLVTAVLNSVVRLALRRVRKQNTGLPLLWRL